MKILKHYGVWLIVCCPGGFMASRKVRRRKQKHSLLKISNKLLIVVIALPFFVIVLAGVFFSYHVFTADSVFKTANSANAGKDLEKFSLREYDATGLKTINASGATAKSQKGEQHNNSPSKEINQKELVGETAIKLPQNTQSQPPIKSQTELESELAIYTPKSSSPVTKESQSPQNGSEDSIPPNIDQVASGGNNKNRKFSSRKTINTDGNHNIASNGTSTSTSTGDSVKTDTAPNQTDNQQTVQGQYVPLISSASTQSYEASAEPIAGVEKVISVENPPSTIKSPNDTENYDVDNEQTHSVVNNTDDNEENTDVEANAVNNEANNEVVDNTDNNEEDTGLVANTVNNEAITEVVNNIDNNEENTGVEANSINNESNTGVVNNTGGEEQNTDVEANTVNNETNIEAVNNTDSNEQNPNVVVNTVNNNQSNTPPVDNNDSVIDETVSTNQPTNGNAAEVIEEFENLKIVEIIDEFIVKDSTVIENFAETINKGLFDINAGASFGTEQGEYTQEQGLTVVNGELVADSISIYGGTLKGSGIIAGNTYIGAGGLVNPGNSPGTLKIDGSLVSYPGGAIELELQRDSIGDDILYDKFVAESYDINGMVEFLLIGHVDLNDLLQDFSLQDFFLLGDIDNSGNATKMTNLGGFANADFFAYQISDNDSKLLLAKLVLDENGKFTQVPEPGSIALMLVGLTGIFGLRRKNCFGGCT
jgi:hypothetical protein